MKTRPIETPRPGMIAYNGEQGNLMVEITDIDGSEFDFHVHNGRWDGTYRDGKISIYLPDGEVDIIDSTPFQEVFSLSADEADRWYTDPVKEVPEALEWVGPLRIDARSTFVAMAAEFTVGLAEKDCLSGDLEDYGFVAWNPDDRKGQVYIGNDIDFVRDAAKDHVVKQVDDCEIAF
jgi:hypothetical protein